MKTVAYALFRNTIFAAGCFFLLQNFYANTVVNSTTDKSVEGKIYVITLTSEANYNDKAMKDELGFIDGKLTSKFMSTINGFSNARYVTTPDSIAITVPAIPAINFASESRKADGDLIRWEGIAVRNSIQGTLVWKSKAGKVKKEYSFNGKLK